MERELKEILDNALEFSKDKCTYVIGIDTLDESKNAYCLGRNTNSDVEVLLAKTIKNKKAFLREVHNLSKYFNAKISKELIK